MRKFMHLLCLLCASLASPAQAQELTVAQGQQLLQRFYQALNQQDLATVDALLGAQARIVIQLPGPAGKRISLQRAEYLQQLKALWAFKAEARYQAQPAQWQSQGSALMAHWQQEEWIRLFGQSRREQQEMNALLVSTQGRAQFQEITLRLPTP